MEKDSFCLEKEIIEIRSDKVYLIIGDMEEVNLLTLSFIRMSISLKQQVSDLR